ncbi:MAG: SEL1-like repeat protein [Sphingomonadaceae bacterium]|nr:SEL1-like repeat protein [Sphingomonadaceae bacterium]
MAMSQERAQRLFDDVFAGHLAGAERGDAQSYFELGMAYSTGSDGCDVDMIEAHKWFNLAALAGLRDGAVLRAEIASEMDREEIAEAQRLARAWLSTLSPGNGASRAAA